MIKINENNIVNNNFSAKRKKLYSEDYHSIFLESKKLLKLNILEDVSDEYFDVLKDSKITVHKTLLQFLEIEKEGKIYYAKYHKKREQDYNEYVTLSIENIKIINYQNPIIISDKIKLNNHELLEINLEKSKISKNKNFNQLLTEIIKKSDLEKRLRNASNTYIKTKYGKKYWNIIINGINQDIEFDYENNFPIVLNDLREKEKNFQVGNIQIMNLKGNGYELINYIVQNFKLYDQNYDVFQTIIEEFPYPEKEELCVFNFSNEVSTSIFSTKKIEMDKKIYSLEFLNYSILNLEKTYNTFKNEIVADNNKINNFNEYKLEIKTYINEYNQDFLKLNTSDSYKSMKLKFFKNIFVEINEGSKEINTNDIYKSKYLSFIESKNNQQIPLNDFETEEIEESIFSLNIKLSNKSQKFLFFSKKNIDNYYYKRKYIYYKNYLQTPFDNYNENETNFIKFDSEINFVETNINKNEKTYLIETKDENSLYDLHFFTSYEDKNKLSQTYIEKISENSFNSVNENKGYYSSFYKKYMTFFNLEKNDTIKFFENDKNLFIFNTLDKFYDLTEDKIKEMKYLKYDSNEEIIQIPFIFNMEEKPTKMKYNIEDENTIFFVDKGTRFNNLYLLNFTFNKNLFTLLERKNMEDNNNLDYQGRNFFHNSKYLKSIENINFQRINNKEFLDIDFENKNIILDFLEPLEKENELYGSQPFPNYNIKKYLSGIFKNFEFKNTDKNFDFTLNNSGNMIYNIFKNENIEIYSDNSKNNFELTKKQFQKDVKYKQINGINLYYDKNNVTLIKNEPESYLVNEKMIYLNDPAYFGQAVLDKRNLSDIKSFINDGNIIYTKTQINLEIRENGKIKEVIEKPEINKDNLINSEISFY